MIRFFQEGISFKLKQPIKTARWIKSIINKEKFALKELNYIFCSDDFLLSINQGFLRHDYYTDIITFDHSSEKRTIEGDIYISVDRVRENAKEFNSSLDTELHRVMIHGVLHLLGYPDKTKAEKMAMRKKEEACLSLR